MDLSDLSFRKYSLDISWRRFIISKYPGLRFLIFLKIVFGYIIGPLVASIAFMCRILKIRFIRFPTHALGHLLLEPDLFLKERILSAPDKLRFLWIIDKQRVSNQALLSIWKQKIPHLQIPFVDLSTKPFRIFLQHPDIFLDNTTYITAINKTGRFARIQTQWGDKRPILSLSKEHLSKGYERLYQMGYPEDGWFVCVHCRDSGYHHGQPDHDFRNGDIRTYQKAIDYIISLGGWVVRLGDPTMPKMEPSDRLIDYAHDEQRDESMDLFFCSECKYILGSCSGPASVPAAFGKPMAMMNCLPLSATTFYCHNGLGIGTPKLLFSRKENRMLSFREIMESDVGNYRWKQLYEKDQLTIIDNDADDILSVAKELHAMSEETFVLSRDDQDLQHQIQSMFRDGHYCYGSACLFSPSFLRKHIDLLINPEVEIPKTTRVS